MTNPVKKLKIALLQLSVGGNKEQNVSRALTSIYQVVKDYNPAVVVLPECFNGPYDTQQFSKYAEHIPAGPTCQKLSAIANELGIYLIGGSIIEKDNQDKFYNTCTIWNPNGELIGKHRKIHLFDINMDSIKFQESSTLTPGNSFTVVDICGRKFGIGICHDIRFEELAKIYRKEGCEMIIYPSAFDVNQGPLHWELLQRSRANDNQLYVASISTARDNNASYVAYGHTMLIDPLGLVVYEAGETEETIIAEIDFEKVESARRQIPIFGQRRIDLYDTLKQK